MNPYAATLSIPYIEIPLIFVSNDSLAERGISAATAKPGSLVVQLPLSWSAHMKLNRREMLRTSLAVSGAALVGSSPRFGVKPFQFDQLPSPESSGIDHIIVVTM